MSFSIQSGTFSGLHSVSVLSKARRRRFNYTSNSEVHFSVLPPLCSMSRSQDEDDGCSNVIYDRRISGTLWMNGCYMDLRMRSNSLLNAEASCALHQHFQHEDKKTSDHDAAEVNESSMFDQMVTRHSSLQPSMGESYVISGLIVFDKSMFEQLDGGSFSQQFGHLVNGFNSGVSSFMDEPFC